MFSSLINSETVVHDILMGYDIDIEIGRAPPPPCDGVVESLRELLAPLGCDLSEDEVRYWQQLDEHNGHTPETLTEAGRYACRQILGHISDPREALFLLMWVDAGYATSWSEAIDFLHNRVSAIISSRVTSVLRRLIVDMGTQHERRLFEKRCGSAYRVVPASGKNATEQIVQWVTDYLRTGGPLPAYFDMDRVVLDGIRDNLLHQTRVHALEMVLRSVGVGADGEEAWSAAELGQLELILERWGRRASPFAGLVVGIAKRLVAGDTVPLHGLLLDRMVSSMRADLLLRRRDSILGRIVSHCLEVHGRHIEATLYEDPTADPPTGSGPAEALPRTTSTVTMPPYEPGRDRGPMRHACCRPPVQAPPAPQE